MCYTAKSMAKQSKWTPERYTLMWLLSISSLWYLAAGICSRSATRAAVWHGLSLVPGQPKDGGCGRGQDSPSSSTPNWEKAFFFMDPALCTGAQRKPFPKLPHCCLKIHCLLWQIKITLIKNRTKAEVNRNWREMLVHILLAIKCIQQ